MKKALIVTLAALFLCSRASAEWKEEKGDHFIVYYADEAAQPKDILLKAEHSYTKIANDLGYARYSNFWQWDKRVKIYVHPSKGSFQKTTGQPDWSDGMASYLDKSIHTIQGTENFLNNILPHEVTHLIFRDFVGPESQVPLWLDEGVAQWEEDDKRAMAIKLMPSFLRRAQAFTLGQLTATDIRRESDPERVGIFYVEAISVVDYLIHTYGASNFTDFCRGLRDRKPFEEALRIAYRPSIQSLEELETKWADFEFALGRQASAETLQS